jgi:carboxyl-terminal processing protease
LKGEEGSKIRIKVWRKAEAKALDINITRGKVPLPSVNIAYMLRPTIGYIKVNRFSNTTPEEFLQALAKLTDEKMEHLVLDLRDNGGGYLRAAVDMLNHFFSEKLTLVSTVGKLQDKKETSNGRPRFEIKKIVVLIDENAASASEIVAGALQDHDRAVLVGRRTFGKGLVQEQYELSGGAALRLTIARYYTPSGRLIQKSYKNGKTDYRKDLKEREQKGELFSSDSIKIADTTRYYTRNGRIVYAGGGITPDVFVPLNNQVQNDYYKKASSELNTFFYQSFEQQGKNWNYESIEDFDKKFVLDDKLYKSFERYLKLQKIEGSPAQMTAAKPLLQNKFKETLARYLFDEIGFYTVKNKHENEIQKAIETIEQKNKWEELLMIK